MLTCGWAVSQLRTLCELSGTKFIRVEKCFSRIIMAEMHTTRQRRQQCAVFKPEGCWFEFELPSASSTSKNSDKFPTKLVFNWVPLPQWIFQNDFVSFSDPFFAKLKFVMRKIKVYFDLVSMDFPFFYRETEKLKWKRHASAARAYSRFFLDSSYEKVKMVLDFSSVSRERCDKNNRFRREKNLQFFFQFSQLEEKQSLFVSASIKFV